MQKMNQLKGDKEINVIVADYIASADSIPRYIVWIIYMSLLMNKYICIFHMQEQELRNDEKSSFFQTQAPKQISQSVGSNIKNHQIHSYITNLHNNINNALSHQNKAISRRKKKLYDELNTVKKQIYIKNEKRLKMQQFFRENCEKLLQADIQKWEDNKGFFQQLFEHYNHQLERLKQSNKAMKQEIKFKKQQVKSIMREQKSHYYEQRVKNIIVQKGLSVEDSTDFLKHSLIKKSNGKSTRVNTEINLPSLTRMQDSILFSAEINKMKSSVAMKPQRLRTLGSQISEKTNINKQKVSAQEKVHGIKSNNRYSQQNELNQKGYMKPLLKTQMFEEKTKKINSFRTSQKQSSIYAKQSNPLQLESLLSMLKWYKNERNRKGGYNWFEKVLFIDRNFMKIQKFLIQAHQEGCSKNRRYKAISDKQVDVIDIKISQGRSQKKIKNSGIYRKINSEKKLKH